MRNFLLSSGVHFKTIAQPKAKEVPAGNSQFKECAASDFQNMLQTACDEHGPVANQVSDGKPLNVQPENRGLGQEQSVRGRKTIADAEKNDTPSLVEPLKDKPTDDEPKVTVSTAEQVAAQGITVGPLNITPTVKEEASTETVAQSDLSLAGAVNQSTAPTLTLAPPPASPANPEVTKLQPSLVMGQLDPTLPDNSGDVNVSEPVLTVADRTSKPPATNGASMPVLPEMTIFDATGVTPSPVAQPLPVISNDALTQPQILNETAAPQTGVNLPQPAIQAGTATVVPNAVNALTPLSKVEAGQSKVALEPGVAINVASGQTFDSNVPAEKMILPPVVPQPAQTLQPDQPAQTVQIIQPVQTPVSIHPVNNPASQNGIDVSVPTMPAASTTTTNQAILTVTPDLNGTVNFNTVMAGMSLRKDGLETGKASVASSVPLAASLGTFVNIGQRLTKTTRTADAGDDATVQSYAMPVETVSQEANTPTGSGQVIARKDVKLNSGEVVSNLQSAPISETAKDPVQAGTNVVTMGKAAVATDAKPAQTSALEERETVARVGQTTSELSGTAVVTAHDKVVQTNQTINLHDVSAANRNELFNQIVEQARIMIHQGQSEMEINLKPDHLGKLKMKIAVEHQVVTAQFVVESEQVRQIIETNLVQLRKLLQEAGAQVENLTVSLGQQNADANLAQQSHSGESGKQAQSQSGSWDNAREMPNRSEENRVASKSQTLVDLIA